MSGTSGSGPEPQRVDDQDDTERQLHRSDDAVPDPQRDGRQGFVDVRHQHEKQEAACGEGTAKRAPEGSPAECRSRLTD